MGTALRRCESECGKWRRAVMHHRQWHHWRWNNILSIVYYDVKIR